MVFGNFTIKSYYDLAMKLLDKNIIEKFIEMANNPKAFPKKFYELH
jgi:hypothetical protein